MQIQSLGQEDPLEESNPLWQPTPVFLPGEFHWQRSLAGYSPWGRQQLDTTEAIQHTHTHTSSLMLCHNHYHERRVSDLCPLICCRASLPCCHSLQRRYSKLQIGSEWHFRDSPSSSIISSSFLIWTCCYRSGLDNPAFSSVQFSRSVMSNFLWPHGLQHAKPPCPSPTPGVYSYSCPLSWWFHPTISSSVIPSSSCLQPFWTSGSFQMSQLFTSGGQSIGVSASTSDLPMNTQDWSPLGWTGWICLQPKGLKQESSPTPQSKSINSSVLSFLYSPTLTSIHDHWKNHSLDLTRWTFVGKVMSGIFICCLGWS